MKLKICTSHASASTTHLMSPEPNLIRAAIRTSVAVQDAFQLLRTLNGRIAINLKRLQLLAFLHQYIVHDIPVIVNQASAGTTD